MPQMGPMLWLVFPIIVMVVVLVFMMVSDDNEVQVLNDELVEVTEVKVNW